MVISLQVRVPKPLVNRHIVHLFGEPCFTRGISPCNVSSLTWEFFANHVVSPPCLYHLLRMFQSFHRLRTFFARWVILPFHKELSSPMPFSVIPKGLDIPFRFFIDQDWRWLDIGSSWESFMVVLLVGFDHGTVDVTTLR